MTRLSIFEPIKMIEFLEKLKWEHGIELKQVVHIPSKDKNYRFDKIGITHDIRSNVVLKAKNEKLSFLIGFDLLERFKHKNVLFLEKNVLYSLFQARLPLFSWEIWSTDVLNVFMSWLLEEDKKRLNNVSGEDKRSKNYFIKENSILLEKVLKKMSMVNLISSLSRSVKNMEKISFLFLVDESVDISREEMILEEKDSSLVIMIGEREKAIIIANKIRLPIIQVSRKKFYFMLTKLMSRELASIFPGLIVKEINFYP